MPDDQGYPKEVELEAIVSWKDLNNPRGWFDAIRAAWWAADWGWSEETTPTKTTLHVSTGGWSGNEEIIGAMQRNILWGATWQSSRRGGHYTFLLERLT